MDNNLIQLQNISISMSFGTNQLTIKITIFYNYFLTARVSRNNLGFLFFFYSHTLNHFFFLFFKKESFDRCHISRIKDFRREKRIEKKKRNL